MPNPGVLAVRRSRRGRRVSVFMTCRTTSWNAVSLLGCSLRLDFGGPPTSPCKRFEIMLCDSPL
jgi:hypothetical protein